MYFSGVYLISKYTVLLCLALMLFHRTGSANDVTAMSITGMCAGGNTSGLVCYMLLVHSDHLARRSPGLPLPSAPLC